MSESKSIPRATLESAGDPEAKFISMTMPSSMSGSVGDPVPKSNPTSMPMSVLGSKGNPRMRVMDMLMSRSDYWDENEFQPEFLPRVPVQRKISTKAKDQD